MENLIITKCQDGVLKIGINNPEKRNALTSEMYRALADALYEGDKNHETKVLLLHGTSNCFTAGNDIGDFLRAAKGDDSGLHQIFRFLSSLGQVKKPLIGVVSGPAVGIGTTALLHCDLVYAGKSAQFKLPFVDLGLCPEAGSSYLLPRLVGHHRAMELFLLCETFDAEHACELGLVNQVYEDEKLMENAMKIAYKLAAKPAASVLLTKAMLKSAHDSIVREILEKECIQIAQLIKSPDAAEAFTAFLEKRQPSFSREH